MSSIVPRSRFASRLSTVWAMLCYFAQPKRLPILIPLLVFLLVGSLLLAATGGLSYVAPFVYTLF